MLTLGDPGFELWNRFRSHGELRVDHPVVARWARVRQLRSAARNAAPVVCHDRAPGFERRRARLESLLARGAALLEDSAAEIGRRGCALVLADDEGLVLGSYGLDRIDRAARAGLRVGACWDETARGTNAIGTALAEDTAVAVVGTAHYDATAHGLVCYAAPVHGVDGNIVAVLDVSGPVESADPLLGVSVQALALAIEGIVRGGAVERLGQQLDGVRKRELEALRARDELAATLRANETFLASVGHDLRSPLAAVTMASDLLLARGDVSISDVVTRIRSSSARMTRMVQELMDLSRARLGTGLQAQARPIDLVALVSRLADEARAGTGQAILVASSGAARGQWDEGHVERVVSNLLDNAVRHGDRTEPVFVRVDGSDPEVVCLDVTSAGVIEAALIPRLFDPFRSFDREQGRADGGGLGLGLFIVQQLVSAHHGRIEVSSLGGRTSFRVILPRDPRAAAMAAGPR